MFGYMILRDNMSTYGNHPMVKGLNVYQGDMSHPDAGFFFFKELKQIEHWLHNGDRLWHVEFPDDAIIEESEYSEDAFRSDKVILLQDYSLDNDCIWNIAARHCVTRGVMEWAIQKGYDRVALFLLQEGYKADETHTLTAAWFNRAEVLNALLAQGIKPHNRCAYVAARYGYLDILKALKLNNIQLIPDLYFWAGANKHDHIINYLLEIDVEIDPRVLA